MTPSKVARLAAEGGREQQRGPKCRPTATLNLPHPASRETNALRQFLLREAALAAHRRDVDLAAGYVGEVISAVDEKSIPGRCPQPQDRNGTISVVPGLDLVNLIREACAAGRPGRLIGEMPEDEGNLFVPIARRIRREANGYVVPWPTLKPLWEEGFSDRLIVALETRHPIALESLQREGSRERTACNDLYLAALHDLRGLPWSDLAVAPLPGGFVFSDETAASRAGRRGRRMWRALGAWPWFHFDDGPTPPTGWRESGASGGWLAGSFEIWRTGRI